jgi:hypothetical protein
MQPKIPIEGNWERVEPPGFMVQRRRESAGQPDMPPSVMYISPLGIQVISSIHIVENANKDGVGPHYHISISDRGERVAASIVPTILRQFGSSDFEEDNHAPLKKIRSFWKPVERPAEECACKENEAPEVHGDYTWRQG